ncbi:GNAT family N-acetyltransferase [Bombella saccharophila]|uniref:GNAT family N-acetyltransferase n=1 Tax=Bombella saccharophila TaxID=2967338 RepID=A0ABT3W474_9PROT|nr:GNAT family N-acetyltransferase [Bombella saccharophila]MCX5613827.1 GNAT family N-acetyltransferase [Bombella saccharophila]
MSDTFAVYEPPSIFHQEWWLEIASRGRFASIDIEMGGKIVSRFPFLVKKTLGSSVIKMPKYTRVLGPYFSLPQSKSFRYEQNIRHVVEKTIERLPKYDGIHFFVDPDNESLLAFRLAGFKILHEFTFRIMPEKSLDAVWQDCDHKTRNLIRTADKKLSVQQAGECETFIALVQRELPHNHHDFPLLKALFEAAYQRGQATALYAYDQEKLVSAALLIWDEKTLYFWQSARCRRSKVPGMTMLLIWKAIEQAKERHLIFDFDSFGSVRTAKMLASFGQKPVPRPEIRFGTWRYNIKRYMIDTLQKHILKKYRSYDLY